MDLADLRVQLREQHLYYKDRLLPVSRLVVHPQFYMAETGVDIALLELEEPVNISSHVRMVTLPPALLTFPAGMPCWVTGWGDVDNSGGSRTVGGRARWTQGHSHGSAPGVPGVTGSLRAAQGGRLKARMDGMVIGERQQVPRVETMKQSLGSCCDLREPELRSALPLHAEGKRSPGSCVLLA
ncbi:hypothetical protein P7K49_022693 [Saguinus oedipus]|uniref:Peptidase S1 domain-containing protein n=1 Tax=Saguinus oedipus TaxID=9490 RepID=A0ABQ9UJJ3_SAGOE|nr:hypothetical protein P7K49_022693 [Saguinus oedipus]